MNIIEINKEQVQKAAGVLVLAFEHDPIFMYIFKTRERYNKVAPWLFATWVQWAVMYGKVWMTEDGNGVIMARKPGHTDMSFVSMVRAGMLPAPFKLGWGAFCRFYFEIVATLDKKHTQIMGRTSHWYGWMVGVYPQKQGIGRALLQYCFTIADRSGMPIFLETATANNVALYEHVNFDLKEKVLIPRTNVTLYFMVRQPQAINS